MCRSICCIFGKNDIGKDDAQSVKEDFTFDDLESVGLGEMGLTLEELYSMTPRQFQNKREGFRRAFEQKAQLEWERVRWLAHVNVSPHTKQHLAPKDLVVFPWEAKNKRSNKVYKAATFAEVQEAIKKVFGDVKTAN